MAEGKVVADDAAIGKLGTKISDFKKDLDAPGKDLDAIAVQAGDFEEADQLRQRIDERKQEVVKFLTAISERLETDGRKLADVAKAYKDTEDDATVKAEDVLPEGAVTTAPPSIGKNNA